MRAYLRAVVTAAAAALFASLIIATPAHATDTTVDTLTELQSALADCASAPNTIILGAGIDEPGASLAAVCDTTIDLSTFDLNVSNVTIGPGQELEISGPTEAVREP